jgi:hypothetical protein
LEPLRNHDVDTNALSDLQTDKLQGATVKSTTNKHLQESWNRANEEMNREVVLSASKIEKAQQQTSLLPETR